MTPYVEAKRDTVECMHPKAKQVWNIKKILNIFFLFLEYVTFCFILSCGYWHLWWINATPTSGNNCGKNVSILKGCWMLRNYVCLLDPTQGKSWLLISNIWLELDHSGLKSQKNVQFSKIPQYSLYYFFSIFDPLWDFFLYLIVTIFNSFTFDILITIINYNYSKPDG